MSVSSLPGKALRLITMLAVLACANAVAWAQVRSIPEKAKRGTLVPTSYPNVRIGSTDLRLAPGALIYDAHNRTILYGYLPKSADAAYLQDGAGLVTRVYLLTAQEQELLDRRKQR